MGALSDVQCHSLRSWLHEQIGMVDEEAEDWTLGTAAPAADDATSRMEKLGKVRQRMISNHGSSRPHH